MTKQQATEIVDYLDYVGSIGVREWNGAMRVLRTLGYTEQQVRALAKKTNIVNNTGRPGRWW